MKDIIQTMVDIVNNMHDFIEIFVFDTLGLNLTDKDLHFWIMGIIGIIIFMFVLLISKILISLPYGITILSFLYTFTFMIVLVFAIEIQQALTNRGNMEFEDAIVGLWGFLAFFLVFLVISAIILLFKRALNQFSRRD
ncbi:hypothetical protein [Bacillus massiliglaciei]|uniref:hypothetical protein n=1 Tax=Bacillus massiliglaciei TaxID=1816693 RepID=UPI000A84DDFF|nr:hypothetical protein [Bacillus massiliglaciei]